MAATAYFLANIFENLLSGSIKFILEELHLPDDVKEKLESLTTDVSMLQAYLGDAAQKQQTNEAVRLWLSNLQEVAYDANDLLDECKLEAQRQKIVHLPRVRNSLSGISLKRRKFLINISNRMKSMKVKMEDITKQRHVFGLLQGQESPPVTRNESSSFGPPLIIGRDGDKRRIIDLLMMSNEAGKSNTSVICIVGIGGLGKTALAQYVYNDENVKKRFKPRCWVHVSQDFKGEKLTKGILESISGISQNSASLDNLQRDLLNKLKGKRYLLVLDDVWLEDWKQWYSFLTPLRHGAMGSKILVTTRTIETAKAIIESKIYYLDPMRDEDCCSLFFHNISRLNPNINVADLRKLNISGEIAHKCNGLPSPAADWAFRLCQEPNTSRWSSILKAESLQKSGSLPTDLSYQLLPSQLKQCFAFCSFFPNDYEFDKEQVIKLWMAQDFIQDSDDKRMEDEGRVCFDLLESRLLFQRFDRKRNRSKYMFHNSIYELARSASMGECVVAKPGQQIGKARHVSLMCHEAETDVTTNFLFDDKLRCIYSLMVFGDSIAQLPDDFTRKLENLRALDLSNTIIQELPNSINSLKHLRYLQLRGTKIRRLPDALSELYFLQTLGLGNCYMLEELPNHIKYLQKLRHIDLEWDDDSMLMMAQEDISWSLMRRHSLRFMPPEIGSLIDLQTLSRFVVSKKSGCGVEELEKLNQLHGELLVSNLHLVQRAEEATKANLKAKQNLQFLELHWADVGKETEKSSLTFRRRRDDVERILYELQPHSNLRGLRIINYMGSKFPNWFLSSYLCNLTSLTLVNCKQCFSLPPLGNLPSLTEIHIEGMDTVCYVNCEFCDKFNATPFRALKKLHLENMPSLKHWRADDKGCDLIALCELVIKNCPMLEEITHAMPSLRKLVIEKTPRLASLPHLPSLHSLKLTKSGELFWNLLSSLPSIHSLSLGGLSAKYLPAKLQCSLNSLQRLDINCCDALECFPDTWPPTNLVHFGVSNCPMLRLLPNDLAKLKALEDMEIRSCPQLLSLPVQVAYLNSLAGLYISDCERITSLPCSLPNTLHILSISNCPELKERCKPGGKDWSKIRDISVWIDGKMVTSPLPKDVRE